MIPSSPSKRRALAPLNANAASPNPRLNSKPSQQQQQSQKNLLSPRSPLGLKRPLQVVAGSDENAIVKKRCQEPEPQARPRPQPTPTASRGLPVSSTFSTRRHDDGIAIYQEPETRGFGLPAPHQIQPLEQPAHQRPLLFGERPRSTSPSASSVFDNSITEASHDNTQDTAITEPDVAPAELQAPQPQPQLQPSLTREEARQKVETLRLRLGLANYKVRTGQEDVPLEQLQARPFHRTTSSVTADSGPQSLSAPSSQETVESDSPRQRKQPVRNPTAEARVARALLRPNLTRSRLMSRLGGLPIPPSPYTSRDRKFEEEEESGEDNCPTGKGTRGGAVNGLLSLARAADS